MVGTEAREVQRRDVAAPRGDRTVIVEGVDVPASEVTLLSIDLNISLMYLCSFYCIIIAL